MRFRLGLVMGFGAGYVLGSRAGRERYEQIKHTAERVWESETVHRAREMAGLDGRTIDLGQDQREMIGAP